MKKLLSICLSILLIISVIPIGTFTASAATNGYYTYTVSSDKATITDVKTAISGDVTIPSTLGGFSVTSIGDDAFYGCSSLTSVTIPDSVTSIGDEAFRGCYSLKSANFPGNIDIIPTTIFGNCTNLNRVYFSKELAVVENGAFNHCDNITEIYYEGTEEEWQKVVILPNNGSLSNAKVIFNATGLLEYTPGNINDDENGVVDLNDVVTLAQYVAGWNVECNEAALDADGSGVIDLNDVVLLAQFVAGWNVQLN